MNDDGDQSPMLTISIVSHGHDELLAALLDDVVRWRKSNSAIVVTLNIPEKDGFDRTRWSGVEWIDNPLPKGFAANHNAALLADRVAGTLLLIRISASTQTFLWH